MICSAGFIYDDAILLTNLNLAKQERREFIGNLNQMLFITRKCATRRFSLNIEIADLSRHSVRHFHCHVLYHRCFIICQLPNS